MTLTLNLLMLMRSDTSVSDGYDSENCCNSLYFCAFMSKKQRKRGKLQEAIRTMDLNRLPNDKKLELCKWYFKVGCMFLPFVWAVNTVWFFKEAFLKPAYEEQRQIKKYVIMSGIGTALWAVALAAWSAIFQLQRAAWGATGDALSFIIPLGRP